jgi:arylsulfatase A-like enzyme
MLCDGRYKLMFGDVTRDRRKEYFRPPYNNQQFGRPVNLPPDLISLYDLKEDPFELRNLADDPRFRSLLEEKKEALLIRMIRNLQSVPEDTRSAF